MGGGRHVDLGGFRQRGRVEELQLVGALSSENQMRPARAVVGVRRHTAPLRRSNASAIFALRPTASSRFSFSSSTTSSGARATKLALPSLASTRAMSASALAISLARRARSAARSITPLSGSAATSPRTTSCTEPCGAVAADEISDTRARRLMNSAQRSARVFVSADAPSSTSGIALTMFISARTERIAVISSMTQLISASALSSVRPSSFGQSLSEARRPYRRQSRSRNQLGHRTDHRYSLGARRDEHRQRYSAGAGRCVGGNKDARRTLGGIHQASGASVGDFVGRDGAAGLGAAGGTRRGGGAAAQGRDRSRGRARAPRQG